MYREKQYMLTILGVAVIIFAQPIGIVIGHLLSPSEDSKKI